MTDKTMKGIAAQMQFREACPNDLVAIVRLLKCDANDNMREGLEHSMEPKYWKAFGTLSSDENNRLIDATGIQHAKIGDVWVATHMKRKYHRLIADRAYLATSQEPGGWFVQPTSGRGRPNAIAFYESYGFPAFDVGLKPPQAPAELALIGSADHEGCSND